MVDRLDRKDLLPYKNKELKFDSKNLYFKFPFDFNLRSLHLSFNSAINSITNISNLNFNELRILNVMQTNLNSFFVHEFKLLSIKKFKFSNCSNMNCFVCPFSNNEFFVLFNDFIVPIQNNSSCDAKEAIYIIKCNLWNSLYIGQSQNFKNRMKTHIKGCKLNIKSYSSCTCVVDHFNISGHKVAINSEFFIFKSNISNKWARLNLETQLINLAARLNVKLLNNLIPDPYYWKRFEKLFLED